MSVFISFSSVDRKIAEHIYDRLSKDKVDCWISSRDIPPGADYQTCIAEAIRKASVVVLVFSSNANKSNEIAKELSLASRNKKLVMPARIEDVVPEGPFEYELANRQFIDLFEDFNGRLEELCRRIQATLEQDVLAEENRPVSLARKGRKRKPMLVAAGVTGLAAVGVLALLLQLAPTNSEALTDAASEPTALTSPPVGTGSLLHHGKTGHDAPLMANAAAKLNSIPDRNPTQAEIEAALQVLVSTPGLTSIKYDCNEWSRNCPSRYVLIEDQCEPLKYTKPIKVKVRSIKRSFQYSNVDTLSTYEYTHNWADIIQTDKACAELDKNVRTATAGKQQSDVKIEDALFIPALPEKGKPYVGMRRRGILEQSDGYSLGNTALLELEWVDKKWVARIE